MRRISLAFAAVALPVFLVSLLLVGCSKDDKKENASNSGGDASQGNTPSGPAKVLEPKGGVLKGKITLASKPNLDDLTKKLQSQINAKTDQKDFCMSGSPSEIVEQQYRVGKNGNLGNVCVWIVPDRGEIFKVDKKELEAVKAHPLKMRQPHCAFIPHCAIAWVEYHPDPKKPREKESTGQYIEAVNDATNAHNTNYGAPKNPSNNVTLAPGKSEKIEKLVAVTEPMTFKCNIHEWMKAYVWLVDTPYCTVSYSDTLDGDNKVKEDDDKFGTYEIKNLPVGKMRVFVWHEECGYLNKDAGKGEEIEISEGKPTTKDFEAKTK
jgi:hypothetical protein